MGKEWDKFSPKEYQQFSQEWGEQALRVLKPGAYLLSFSGTRTYHRMVVGLEDAGFTIKDQISWVFGSGFPKSHNISKAIDRMKGEERKIIGEKKTPDGKPYSQRTPHSSGEYNDECEHNVMSGKTRHNITITKPTTPEAERWDGYGTALKPAHEPIVLAQKPREGTYAENVLKYGVGGLNIDDCRIGGEEIKTQGWRSNKTHSYEWSKKKIPEYNGNKHQGRFPANIIFDLESAKLLDEQSGESKSGRVKKEKSGYEGESVTGFLRGISTRDNQIGDRGGVSRFFYCAKAHKSERNAGLEDLEDVNYGQSGGARQSLKEGKEEYLQDHIGLNKIKKVKNDIATLKPINLMRYLVRLITPPEGTVLDPFGGSGTTGCACEIEGFDYILIEKRKRFAEEIIPRRLDYWSDSSNWDELKNHSELPTKNELVNSRLTEWMEIEKETEE